MFTILHVLISENGRVRVRERYAAGFEDEDAQAAPRKEWRKRENGFSREPPERLAALLMYR